MHPYFFKVGIYKIVVTIYPTECRILSQKSEFLRQKVWYIINTIQANQLYVHSQPLEVKYLATEIEDKKGRIKKNTKMQLVTKQLPEILTICVLNALVPNSAMLLIGGHGGGKTSLVKYLGRMFTGMSLSDAEECIIRGHPQLTEEKIIGTLNIKKLMKDGEEEVVWRSFSKSFWKIIDEVNRCSPYVQNILLSLLAEGKIKYYDSIQHVEKYVLYATLNPHDVGTFEMSAPFMDRFGISVPISMPKSQDLAVILQSHDEKLGGYDELIQVPQVLSIENLLSIWYEVEGIPCTKEAEDFIHAIVREFTLCDRIDKGNSEYLKPSSGLCSGCHFNISERIPCNNVDSILSVRVAKDMLRYARALTWLLGLNEVTIQMVLIVAPYVIAHRVIYLDRLLNQAPYWGNKVEFTKYLLEMVQKRYNTRLPAYNLIRKMQQGETDSHELAILSEMANNDLIVKYDLHPLATELVQERYQSVVKEINLAEEKKNLDKILEIRQFLLQEMDFPCRGELITRLNRIMRILTLNAYNCTMQVWDAIRFTIDGLYPQFAKKLKETTERRGTYLLRAEDIVMEINVTGIKPTAIVNFNFFGGPSAYKLKSLIEERYRTALKTTEELIAEIPASDQEFEAFKQELKTPPAHISSPQDPCEKLEDDLEDDSSK
jgi:MoxR-like ATPase